MHGLANDLSVYKFLLGLQMLQIKMHTGFFKRKIAHLRNERYTAFKYLFALKENCTFTVGRSTHVRYIDGFD